ncbi:MAG: hypothetical protein HQM14_08995 [SAR324 cluster bacterium]|nr:hypothetical protein [SAR324 cluster bacterium]
MKNKIKYQAAVILMILIGFLLPSCTTRKTFQWHPLYTNLHFEDDAIRPLFERIHQNASLYQDYKTILIVDAIFKDIRYRQHFSREIATTYFLTPEQAKNLEKQQIQQFQNQFEFIVFLYGGSNDSLKLDTPAAHWKVYLKDDDGDLLQPTQITKLDEEHQEIRFLQKYIKMPDRWAEKYLIVFPKLSKTAILESPGKSPFQLIITSFAGKSLLSWQENLLFYQ